MSARVRLYTYSGLAIAKVQDNAGQLSFPALTMFKQPYMAKQVMEPTTGGNIQSSAALTPSNTNLLHVQVQTGKRVHYELTPNGQDLRPATTESPTIEGNETLNCGSGWVLSLLEADITA